MLTLSGRVMHIWYSGRMHTPPVGVTFNFSLLDFTKHIYTIVAIVRLVCYACKRTAYKHQYFYASFLVKKNIFVKNCKTKEQRLWAELTVKPSRPEMVMLF